MTRRELREHCFKMLFCADFYNREEAKKQLGLDIDKKKMKLDVPIKALGNYIIQIKLHKDVTAELTVKVVEK